MDSATLRHARDRRALFEQGVREDLRERRWLRMHVSLIGAFTVLACWGISSALLHAGVASLPMRHAGALIGAYGVYLLLLWLWSHHLIQRESSGDCGSGIDAIDAGPVETGKAVASPVFRSGGGGDFGGGGANGAWSGEMATPGPKSLFDGVGDGASSAIEALGSADEGVVVAVPLIVLLGIATLVAAAFGFVIVGLFGIEVLMGAAVEIAVASAGGAIALQAGCGGWATHVVKRTAGPMAAALVAGVLASTMVAHWLPDAETLPDAFRALSSAARPGLKP